MTIEDNPDAGLIELVDRYLAEMAAADLIITATALPRGAEGHGDAMTAGAGTGPRDGTAAPCCCLPGPNTSRDHRQGTRSARLPGR